MRPRKVTCTIVSPTAREVATPLDVMLSAAGFELTHSGAALDGGTPGARSTFTVNCCLSPTLSTVVSGAMLTELTCATAVALVLEGPAGSVDVRLHALVRPAANRTDEKTATLASGI